MEGPPLETTDEEGLPQEVGGDTCVAKPTKKLLSAQTYPKSVYAIGVAVNEMAVIVKVAIIVHHKGYSAAFRQ